MYKYIPTMYKKSIFDISYKVLKDMGIKYLLFDLDNTIMLPKSRKFNDNTISFIKKLSKEFKIVLVSNSGRERVNDAASILGIDYVSNARKPFSKGFNKVISKYNCKKSEMALIGDQLLTDVKGGTRFGILTILVDRLGPDRFVTIPNRIIENMRLVFLRKKNVLERGKYYE